MLGVGQCSGVEVAGSSGRVSCARCDQGELVLLCDHKSLGLPLPLLLSYKPREEGASTTEEHYSARAMSLYLNPWRGLKQLRSPRLTGGDCIADVGHVDVVAIALLAVPLGNRYWQAHVVMWLGQERTG